MFVREWQDGLEVERALVVREVEVRSRRDGAPYLKVQLGDRTGSVAAMVWEDVATMRELCRCGCVVWVRARYSVHPRYGPQLAVGGGGGGRREG